MIILTEFTLREFLPNLVFFLILGLLIMAVLPFQGFN